MVKKILNHSFLLLIANSFGRVSMFLANIFAARLLSQEIFGQYSMIRSTISMIASIISSSLGPFATKRISECNTKEKSEIVWSIYIIGLFISLMIIFILLYFDQQIIDRYFISEKNILPALRLGGLLVLVTVFSTFGQSLIIGLEQFKYLAITSVIVSLVSIPIIYLCIYFLGLTGAIGGVIVYFTLDSVSKLFIIKNDMKPVWTNVLKKIKESIVFGSVVLISIIIGSVSFWYARVLLIRSTNAFLEIGIFDAAYQWLTVIMIITGATTSVALPMFSKALAKNNKIEMKNVFKINFFTNMIIVIFMAIVFSLFSKEIMSIYGEKYMVGASILRLLCVVAVFFTLSSILNKYMISHGEKWIFVASSTMGAITLFTILRFEIEKKAEALALSFIGFYIASSIIYIIYYFYLEKRKEIQ